MIKNSKKLKIGFVVDDGLDRPDGVQQYVLTLGSWFSSIGHEVHYLVGNTTRTDIPNVHSLSNNVTVKFNGNKLSSPLPANKKRIKILLEEQKYDVLHVQMPYSPFFAAKVVRHAPAGTAIVGTFHILPYGWQTNIGNRLLGILLQPNLMKFDDFIAVSSPAKDFARKSFKITCKVIPNTVHIEKFKSHPVKRKKSPVQLVFLGRLVPRKGCFQLLKAVKNLVDSGVEGFHVSICGDGQQRKQLEEYAHINGIDSYVTFLGFIDESDKSKILSGAHIAVFPSISGESFGIVLIEAIASGSEVVIGGNNPGYSYVLENSNEVIFDPNDTNEFADLLSNLIRNDTNRKKINAWQNILVKKYDTGTVGLSVLNLYNQCIVNHMKNRATHS